MKKTLTAMPRLRQHSASKYAADDSSDEDISPASCLDPAKKVVQWADERGEELEDTEPEIWLQEQCLSNLSSDKQQAVPVTRTVAPKRTVTVLP